MDITRSFRTVRKNGYDPLEVSQILGDSGSRKEELVQSIRSGKSTVEKLERELQDFREALRRSNSKPTFADLGSAFEQTLRVAEEQAEKLVKDAEADAKVIRESARAEAENHTRVSRNKAHALIAETEAKIEERRLSVEREIAQLTIRSEALTLQANTARETAQRREAALIAEAERDAADVRARMHQEVEDAKSELETLRQIAEREQFRIQREIKLAMEESERQRLSTHEEAVKFVESQNVEGNVILQDAEAEAENLNRQTEDFMATARQNSESLLASARQSATNLISRARSRAETLAILFDEHALEMMEKAQRRRDGLERQREAMREFSLELKALASADAMVSIDESESSRD